MKKLARGNRKLYGLYVSLGCITAGLIMVGLWSTLSGAFTVACTTIGGLYTAFCTSNWAEHNTHKNDVSEVPTTKEDEKVPS